MDSQTRELLRSIASSLQETATSVLRLETRIIEAEVNQGRPSPPEQLLTTTQVAELLSVSRGKVDLLIEQGRLRARRVGEGNIRITRSEYDRFVAACPVECG